MGTRLDSHAGPEGGELLYEEKKKKRPARCVPVRIQQTEPSANVERFLEGGCAQRGKSLSKGTKIFWRKIPLRAGFL